MRHDRLWWKVFRVWFGAAILFYNTIVLPGFVMWAVYFLGYSVRQLYGFSVIWIIGSPIIAYWTGRYVANLGDKESCYGTISMRTDKMERFIAGGLQTMLYTNPFGLAYAFCVFIIWRRVVAPIRFAFVIVGLALGNLSSDSKK